MQLSIIDLPDMLSVSDKTKLKHKSLVSGTLLDNIYSESIEVLMSVNNQIYDGIITFEDNFMLITQGDPIG